MTGDTCPRCHGPLPETVVRAMAAGTTCPFCGENLKRTPTHALDAPPADDEGYDAFEVAATAAPAAAVGLRPAAAAKPAAVGLRPAAPPAMKPAATPINPAAAPAPAKAVAAAAVKPAMATVKPAAVVAQAKPAAAPVKPAAAPAPGMTAAAAPKSFRQTMVGAALAPRDLPFEGTPAPISLSVSPPVSTPLTRPPAAPAAAAARVVPISSAPAAAAARVAPQAAPPSTPAPRALSILDDDSGPTHAVLPSAIASEAVTPLFEGMDSAPIASVTVMPDPTPMAPTPSALQPAPPRRLAFLGIGMGLMIVVVAFLVIKVVGGRKGPAKPVATEVARAAPEPVVAEPVAVVEPVLAPKAPAPPAAKAPPAARPAPEPRAKATPAAPTKPSKAALRAAKLAEKRERAAAKLAEKRERAAAKLAEKRERVSQAKARHTTAPRARKVAMAKTTAKASAPSAPAEHADARPSYERGNAALLAGDGKAAIAAYRDAVKSSPSDPIGFRGLGLAYEHEGETAAAVKALRRYLKLAPDAPDRAIISRRLDRLTARQTKRK